MTNAERAVRTLSRARQGAIDHVDGVLQAVERDERAEARAFLLAEQHLVQEIEPVERHARAAVLALFLRIEERLAAADLVDDVLDVLRRRFRRQLRPSW